MSDRYRCAIVGVSGGRARGHAEAFAHMPRGELTAVSTRTAENLRRFADQWDVPHAYTDYTEMFREQDLDLVLVNTPPDVRLEVLEAADLNGVGSVIVEKPLALQGEDWQALTQFAEQSRLKVAINHQLHYQPRRLALQKLVRRGGIGTIRRLNASARMNMAYQGTHVLQAVHAFQPSPPVAVSTSLLRGATGLEPNPRMHLAPDECEAEIRFADGSTARFRCGTNAPADNPEDTRISHHKQVAATGETGSVQWTMTRWETRQGGRHHHGTHDYHEEDIMGQANMCEAMFDWLEDDTAVHALNLDAALRDFRLMLAMYMSGLSGRPESLEVPPMPDLLTEMRSRLT